MPTGFGGAVLWLSRAFDVGADGGDVWIADQVRNDGLEVSAMVRRIRIGAI